MRRQRRARRYRWLASRRGFLRPPQTRDGDTILRGNMIRRERLREIELFDTRPEALERPEEAGVYRLDGRGGDVCFGVPVQIERRGASEAAQRVAPAAVA